MYVIRKKLSATEGNAPGTRYNPDCNCFEVTPDGGTTWNPDPGADPRTNTALYLPPADTRCAAAAGMRLFVQDFIDNTYLAFSIVGISSAAIGIGAVFLPGIGQLVALAWALGDFMLSVGELTLQVTFDNDLYDQLECIFYCNLDDDGRLDQARLDAVGVDIQEIIDDGNVNIVMAAMFNLYGFVGFTNAGVTYADDEANCDDCACGWCYKWQGAPLGDWQPSYLPYTPTFDGTAWNAYIQDDSCLDHAYLYIDIDAVPGTEFGRTEVTLGSPVAGGGFTASIVRIWDGGSFTDFVASPVAGSGDLVWAADAGGAIGDRIEMVFNACTSPTGFQYVAIQVEGIGTNPFGTDNC